VNDFALEYMTRHRDRPFFLYYPMILTHDPFQPTPDSRNWDPHTGHLAKDIGETTNVAGAHPEVTAAMEKLLRTSRTESCRISTRSQASQSERQMRKLLS
jgi:arylsulfatase A